VDRPEYATGATQQLAAAQESQGGGDIGALLRSRGTWNV